jgi:hypothetical protein
MNTPATTSRDLDTAATRELRQRDHQPIVGAAEHARDILEYTILASAFRTTRFTIGEPHQVYEISRGHELDPRYPSPIEAEVSSGRNREGSGYTPVK